MLAYPIDTSRVEIIAELLSNLGFEGIVRFDELEPEYHVLKVLFRRGVKPEYLSLIAISAGVVDFQLGRGGAEEFFNTLMRSSQEFTSLNDLRQVKTLMDSFLKKPINARLRDIKIRRINTIFDSGFANWLVAKYRELKSKPLVIWEELSRTLKSGMEKKTMVFAMKAFDLAHLIVEGDYADFPENIPIPVDFHVRNIALSSGILTRQASDDAVRKAWALVLGELKKKIRKRITLLRVDSLVWQVGKIIYKCNFNRKESTKEIIKYFVEEGKMNEETAYRLAEELTKYVEKLKIMN